MTQDTKLQQLVINKLTTAQYQAALNAGTIDPNQLYMTTDSQTLRDVTVGGSSIVSNNTVALGTMALETASNYSTKAVADTLYAQKALETTVAGKLDKISTASKVYGTDVNGNQTSYDITSFGNVDDVKVGTTSVVANKIATLGTMAGQPTTNYYTKTEIDGKLSAGMHYKGTVASYDNLPSSDNQIGDLYNVTDTGSNYAWDGTAWDKLSENIDLSGVVPNTRTINGKELSTNITLSASDVGALPSSTVIPSVDQTYSSSSTSTNALSHKAIADAKFLQNTGSTYSSVAIVGTSNIESSAVVIGYGASAGQSGVYNGNNEIAIGYNAKAKIGDGIAVGYKAETTAGNAIQLGRGTNSEANTFYVGLSSSNNYKLLGSDGKIPDDRLNTTIARTSSLPSIATTSTAGLVKPDGTSITVDANGVISSAAGAEIDNETITQNGDNELQTVAIVNPNINSGAISPLKIWNGTEYQWNYGEATTWNYWQTTPVTVFESLNSPFNDNIGSRGSFYANGKLFLWTYNGNLYYSSDNGSTWGNITTFKPTNESFERFIQILYGNNIFVLLASGFKPYYSLDGLEWNECETTITVSGKDRILGAFTGTEFIFFDATTKYYSSDGINWNSTTISTTLYTSWDTISSWCYGNGKYILGLGNSGSSSLLISSDGLNWTTHSITGCMNIMFCNDKFLCGKNSKIYYSLDGLEWNECENTTSTTSYYQYFDRFAYSNGIYVAVSGSQSNTANYIQYSFNGIDWIRYTTPSTKAWRCPVGVNNSFFIPTYKSNVLGKFSIEKLSCYTLDSTPTTSTQVYSSPEITSTKTISSVGSGTITLSDNNVYSSTPSGNQNTYRTLGAAHPDWLCNINNVGVKIGNTTIATAGGGSGIEEITDSEIEELWEQ